MAHSIRPKSALQRWSTTYTLRAAVQLAGCRPKAIFSPSAHRICLTPVECGVERYLSYPDDSPVLEDDQY